MDSCSAAVLQVCWGCRVRIVRHVAGQLSIYHGAASHSSTGAGPLPTAAQHPAADIKHLAEK